VISKYWVDTADVDKQSYTAVEAHTEGGH